MYKTADGEDFEVGSLVFSHYTMTPLVVESGPDDQGWFRLKSYPLPEMEHKRNELLNEVRLCSLERAQRMGWISEEQVRIFRLEHECPQCWDAPCHCGLQKVNTYEPPVDKVKALMDEGGYSEQEAVTFLREAGELD